MYDFDYYSFLENKITNDVKNEIEYYSNCSLKDFILTREHIRYLEGRIRNVDVVKLNKCDRYGGQTEMHKMNVEEHSKELDNMIYKRDWSKLNIFHKKKKITEYVEKLEYSDLFTPSEIEKNKKYLIENIFEGLNNKKFNKNQNVIEYDSEKMEITLIDCIVKDEKNNKYRISWVKKN